MLNYSFNDLSQVFIENDELINNRSSKQTLSTCILQDTQTNLELRRFIESSCFNNDD